MRISKVWQWIRDKKTNTIRKWRSTFLGFGTASTFEGGERCFASELDVPESSLKPIGGSYNVLTSRTQSERLLTRDKKEYKKRRTSEKLNGANEPLILKEDWDQVSFDEGYRRIKAYLISLFTFPESVNLDKIFTPNETLFPFPDKLFVLKNFPEIDLNIYRVCLFPSF